MYIQDIKEKWKRNNKLLLTRESVCLQELLFLIRMQSHKTLALWALECVQSPVAALKVRYPADTRPQTALCLSAQWAAGHVKMPAAKQAILQVHGMGKELSNPADIALCHAVGQACSTVHVETHAIGLPIYELTALVHECGIKDCEAALSEKIAQYISCLNICAEQANSPERQWAAFLLDDTRKNKEQLLWEKTRKAK